MLARQQKFYNYILKTVKEDRKEEAKTLLLESFEKQNNGSFNIEYVESFIFQMMELIKEENIAEVKKVMLEFKARVHR